MKLLFTYLMGWLILHNQSLMAPGSTEADGTKHLFLYRYRLSKWAYTILFQTRRALNIGNNWSFYCATPDVATEHHGSSFIDKGTTISKLSSGVFAWLMFIRPSHLIYRNGNNCTFEPYLPSHFVRQFGYDQLYVGNATPGLGNSGGLIDGVRGWRYFIMGYTGATFTLPAPELAWRLLHSFAQFYCYINQFSKDFDVRTSFRKSVEKAVTEPVGLFLIEL